MFKLKQCCHLCLHLPLIFPPRMIPERVLYTFDATLQTEVIKEVHVIQEMQVEIAQLHL